MSIIRETRAYMDAYEQQSEINEMEREEAAEVPKVPRAYWRAPRRKFSTASLPDMPSLELLELPDTDEEAMEVLRQRWEEEEDEEAVTRRVRNETLAASRHWIMEDDVPGLAAPVYRHYRREVGQMLAGVANSAPLTPAQKAWQDHVDALQELDGVAKKTPEQAARLAALDEQTLEIRAAWKEEEAQKEEAEIEFLTWIASAEAKEAARLNYMRQMEVEYARKKIE